MVCVRIDFEHKGVLTSGVGMCRLWYMGALWKVGEAAAYLACTPGALRVRVARGQVPHIRVGGGRSIRFRQADLDRWLDGDAVGVVGEEGLGASAGLCGGATFGDSGEASAGAGQGGPS